MCMQNRWAPETISQIPSALLLADVSGYVNKGKKNI